MSQISMPAAQASSYIFLVLANGARPIWQMFAARQAVFEQAAHRVSVHRSAVGLAHVEMGVEGDEADPRERQPEAVRRGSGHRIVAADEEGEVVARRALLDREADRIEAVGRRHAPHRHVAGVTDGEVELQPRGQVEGAEPPERPPYRLRGEVAAAGRHRAGLHRRAEDRHRGAPHPRRSGRRSISSSSFAPLSRCP